MAECVAGRRFGPGRVIVALGTTIVLMVGGLGSRPSAAASLTSMSVLGWSPGIEQGVPLRAPLTVYFNRRIDAISAERSWRLAPAIAGRFSAGGNALTFRPARPLRPGSRYQLTIDAGARAAAGSPLLTPFSVSFTTGDALRVTSISPVNGTIGVPVTGLLGVTFNHPMVPLAGLGGPVRNPAGWRVRISPHLSGYGYWLGTSTWLFHADRGLQPSTHYVVALSGSVRDASGELLARSIRWAFHTITPEIFSRSPRNGSSFVDPRTAVSVTFNQPMDHRSTARAFTVTVAGARVAGIVGWKGTRLIFHPAAALDAGRAYAISVARNARSSNGHATLGARASWRFSIAPRPRLVDTTPASGGTAVENTNVGYGVRGCPNGCGYSVQLQFNTPMNKRSLDHHLIINPSLPHLQTWFGGPDDLSHWTYGISGDFNPSTHYTVSLSPGVVDQFGRPLGDGYSLPFKTSELTPALTLYGMPGAPEGISFSASRVTQAPVQAINVAKVTYTLTRTTLKAIAALCCGATGPPAGTKVRTWDVDLAHPLNKIENAGVSLANGDGSPLAPGLYWLGASPDSGESVSEIVIVTNVGMTMKTGGNGTLVWVDSSQTGDPLPGVDVQLLDYQGNRVATGKTGAHGVAFFHHPPQNTAAALLDDRVHYGLTKLYWTPNSTPFDYPGTFAGFFGGQQYSQPSNGTYLYTDRPVYRPGQRVHFRGVLWRDRDGVYSTFGSKVAAISAFDSYGRSLLRTRLDLDRFGAIHGSFLLPGNTPTGNDSIYVNLSNLTGSNASFTVAEYRKPEFLTTVVAAHQRYAQGETVSAAAQVRYVFGAPAIHQPVMWVAYAQPLVPRPPGWDTYTFFDWESLGPPYWQMNNGRQQSQFGAEVAKGAGLTDSQGRLAISFLAKLSTDVFDRTLTIEATATDAGHQSVSARTQVAEYHSDLAIGLSAESQVVPAGQQATVDVVAVKQDGTVVPGKAVSAAIFKRTYSNRLVDSGSGQSEWQAVPHDAPITTESLTTDGKGKAQLTFTPADGGEYRVQVTAKDDLGNTTQTAISIDASAAGLSDWGGLSDTSLALKADKTAYNVGDTAHILVPAPFDQGTALVTLERGTIRQYWVEHLTTNSATVDIPITLADLPNVFATVTLYHGWRGGTPPDWRYGAVDLHVRVDPRHLLVHLAQEGYHHHPGDPVRYAVTTTDTQGHAVSAEISLALVDTAVLALQDESNPDILKALYSERPLGVYTSSQAVLSIDHLVERPDFLLRTFSNKNHAANDAAAPRTGGGGGGGGYQSANSAAISVRSHFADTAYWSGAVTTDSSGRATVCLRLPDNATTWRLDARAISLDQSVGQGQLRTLASQDLVVRPVAPRFLVEGDSVRLGAVVNNTLHRAVTVAVSFTASGVAVQSRARPVIRIPAGAERLLLWPVTVGLQRASRIEITARPSTAGVRGDAVALRLPVYPPLTGETVATSGQVFGSTRQLVIVPSNAVVLPGALTVQISASLVAGIGAAFQQLQPSAYESNEAIADRVLAAGSLRTLPASIAGLRVSTYRRLPAVIAAGNQELLDHQLGDGGWPWFNGPWEYSDPEITAGTVHALAGSGQHGPLIRRAIARGRSYLLGALNQVSTSERPHLLLVLAQSGIAPRRQAESLYAHSIQRLHLDAAALAELGMTLARGRDLVRSGSLLADLDARAMVSATGAHWESSGWNPWSGNAIAATTNVLATLVALRPHDPFVPAAVRWLMLSRQGNGWDCQYDTAQAIAALALYAHAAREGSAEYQYQLMVNGRVSLRGGYGAHKQRGVAVARVPIAHLRRGGANAVTVDRYSALSGTFGSGPLYYVARMKYYLPAVDIAPRNEGVSVARRYLDLSGHPIRQVRVGSALQVELTVHTDQTLLYLDLEDPLPVGCEAIDQSLNTSQQGLFKPPVWWQPFTGSQDLTWYLTHTDLHDDRVSLYAYYLPPGTYRYTYLADATVPGSYGVPPTHISETFFPEVFGRSAGQRITVTG